MDDVALAAVLAAVALVGSYVGAHFGLKRRVRIPVPLPGKPHTHDMHIRGKRKGKVWYGCVEEECGFEQYEDELNGR